MYLAYLFKGGKANATRPDPVREECDIPVKIADLGNACWTVGLNSSCIISFVSCKIDGCVLLMLQYLYMFYCLYNLWVQAPVESKQRLYNWYFLLLR